MSRTRNILQLIESSGPGGAETVMVTLAQHIQRDRYVPSVVLMRDGWLREHLEELEQDVTVIHSAGSFDLSFVRRLSRYCKERRIELIHSHLPGANLYACLTGMMARIPVVTTYHGELLLPGSTERFRWIKYKLVSALASRIVLVADYLKPAFVNDVGMPDAKMTTVYNGIPLGPANNPEIRIKKRQELGIGEDAVVIGNVANLRTPKGHRFLVRAAAKLRSQFPTLKVYIVGEGEGKLKTELESEIRSHGLEDCVHLLGFRRDVRELLTAFDLFAMSSISEGLPLSAIEAMSVQLPVVATNVGGLGELVESDKTGYLVPPADAEALVDACAKILSDPDTRQAMGKAGREVVEGAFSVDAMVAQYQDLYTTLIKKED